MELGSKQGREALGDSVLLKVNFSLGCDRLMSVVRAAIQTDRPPNFRGFHDMDRVVVDVHILQTTEKRFPHWQLRGLQIGWERKGEALSGRFC